MTIKWSTVCTSECLIFFWHLVAFLSSGVDYGAAVFHACKMCAFNQLNGFVLIAKCNIFFHHFSEMHFILFYILQSKQARMIEWNHTFYMVERLQHYNQYLVIKLQPNAKKMSNTQLFLLFKTAKRFAWNLFAPHHHTNVCKVKLRMWTSPCDASWVCPVQMLSIAKGS